MSLKDCVGPDRVLWLSFVQSFRRILYMLRVCIWWLTFSLLIVTIPPAQAGLYYAVREGLRDPFERYVKPREAFLRGVGLYLKRSYFLTFLNLAALALILFGVLFWFTREDSTLRLLTVPALAFLFFWWLCQPLLLPALIEHPELSTIQAARLAMRTVVLSPFYALAIAMAYTVVYAFGIALLGPSLFYIPSLLALISLQALWGMTCTEIPDLVDPVAYADRRRQAQVKSTRTQK